MKHTLYTIFTFCITVILVFNPIYTATAIEGEDDVRFYSANDILYYSRSAIACVTTAGSASTLISADENKNLQAIYNYFIGKGLSQIHAAAIVGNIAQESRGNPTLTQSGPELKDPTPLGTAVGVGKAWGLIQWDAGGRIYEYAKKAGVTFSDEPGRHIYDLGPQLDIVWWQLQNEAPTGRKNVLATIQKTTTVESATETFSRLFFAPGTPMMPKRISYAKSALQYPVDNTIANQVTTTDSFNNCNPNGGATGSVNADGYTFPLALPKDDIGNWYKWPCPNVCHHDGSGAVDIAKKSLDDKSVGVPVLAIHSGVLENVRASYQGQAGCNSFQLVGDDGWKYWHGHIQQALPNGTKVEAGQQIAVIGERRCTGNGSGPHLHIDRGYPKGHWGGTLGSRDPSFPALINKLYEGLSS